MAKTNRHAISREGFKTYLTDELAHLERELAKFQADFAERPAHAFEWANNNFRHAAKQALYREILNAVTVNADLTFPMLREELLSRVLRKARWPEQSTSVPHNLMAQYTLAVTAEALEDWKNKEFQD